MVELRGLKVYWRARARRLPQRTMTKAPTSVCGTLKQAEPILAAGWSKKDLSRGGHSIVGAVYATDATPALKSETVIFLNQCVADYAGIPRHTAVGPAIRYFNDRLPNNDGKRQALLFLAEAIDDARETLGR